MLRKQREPLPEWSWISERPGTERRPKRGVTLAVVIVLTLIGGGSGAAWGYDHASARTFDPQTTMAGVDIGGMTVAEAVERVTAEIVTPLHEPIEVRAPGFEAVTTPWALGLQVDVEVAVREAYEAERSRGLLYRVRSRLTGGGTDVDLEPTFDHAPVEAFVEEAAQNVQTDPVDASLDLVDAWVEITPEQVGRELDRDGARAVLIEAAERGAGQVALPVETFEPEIRAADFGRTILIRTGENRLYLFEGDEVVREYPVASGMPGHASPSGTFEITAKRYMPTWGNPGSAWARNMPRRIGPGPNNPLGTRAMNIGNTLHRIHGTPDRSSIGNHASRGCIRMLREHVEELYDLVGVGDRVIMVRA